MNAIAGFCSWVQERLKTERALRDCGPFRFEFVIEDENGARFPAGAENVFEVQYA
jgi:hypothetical protein